MHPIEHTVAGRKTPTSPHQQPPRQTPQERSLSSLTKPHTDQPCQTPWYRLRRRTRVVQTCLLARHPDHRLTGWSHYQPARIAHIQPPQPTPTALLPSQLATLECVVCLYASSCCYLIVRIVAQGHSHARIRVKQWNLGCSTLCFDLKRRIADTPQRHPFGQVLQDMLFTFRQHNFIGGRTHGRFVLSMDNLDIRITEQ